MQKRKLLIATTNLGKLREITSYLQDLPFEILSLKDMEEEIEEPLEDADTIEENSCLKAKYYAKKTNLLTISDDGGIFINALKGWPGVKSARTADSDDEKVETVLKKLEGFEDKSALFRTAISVYDPEDGTYFVALGELAGQVQSVNTGHVEGSKWGYNSVFYIPKIDKTYSQLSINEKNSYSHRGKALNKIQYYLQDRYAIKHMVVPVGIVVRDGKVLLNKRNDPHRPEYHGIWETPGGAVERGENLERCLIREVKEEAGYEVQIVQRINKIHEKEEVGQNYSYQVYIIPFVCKIKGGDGKFNDHEVIESGWFDLDEIVNLNLREDERDFFREINPEIKQIIEKNS